MAQSAGLWKYLMLTVICKTICHKVLVAVYLCYIFSPFAWFS